MMLWKTLFTVDNNLLYCIVFKRIINILVLTLWFPSVCSMAASERRVCMSLKWRPGTKARITERASIKWENSPNSHHCYLHFHNSIFIWGWISFELSQTWLRGISTMAGCGRPPKAIIGTEEDWGNGYLPLVVEEHYNSSCTYVVKW